MRDISGGCVIIVHEYRGIWTTTTGSVLDSEGSLVVTTLADTVIVNLLTHDLQLVRMKLLTTIDSIPVVCITQI